MVLDLNELIIIIIVIIIITQNHIITVLNFITNTILVQLNKKFKFAVHYFKTIHMLML